MNIQRLYGLVFRLGGFRRRRMELFRRLLAPGESTRILDVGGTFRDWRQFAGTPQITLLNLDAAHDRADYPPHVRFQRGDALALDFADGAFDIVFSNSVIEHVGTWERQQRFAAESRRVGRRLWVQTPAREFFVEPHLITPFIHWLPRSWRRRLLRNFTVWGWVKRPSREEVERFLAEVRLLGREEMQALFPDCRIHVERWLGLPKAYVAYRP